MIPHHLPPQPGPELAPTTKPRPHPVIDIHSHFWPPAYVRILKTRTEPPMIETYLNRTYNFKALRLIMLEGEKTDESDLPGRPFPDVYTDMRTKLKFMSDCGISASVLSLPSPNLDFVDKEQVAELARHINEEFEYICNLYPGKLYFFAVLPLSGTGFELRAAVRQLTQFKWCRGVFLCSDYSFSLQEPALQPLWDSLANAWFRTHSGQFKRMVVFLHPHHGLAYAPGCDDKVGPTIAPYQEFPCAFVSMILRGVFDRVPKHSQLAGSLPKHVPPILLAHGGGQFLYINLQVIANYISATPRQVVNIGQRVNIWAILRELVYFDTAVPRPHYLLSALMGLNGGSSNIVFGTNHPFCPSARHVNTSMLSAANVERTLKNLALLESFRGGQVDMAQIGHDTAELLGIETVF